MIDSFSDKDVVWLFDEKYERLSNLIFCGDLYFL